MAKLSDADIERIATQVAEKLAVTPAPPYYINTTPWTNPLNSPHWQWPYTRFTC